jgi:phosphatidate cytidylyltransferase
MADRAGRATSGARWRDLQTRVISAVVLIPVVIAVVRLGGWWYVGVVTLIAVLMAAEWTRLVHASSMVQFCLHAGGGIAAAVLPAFLDLALVACVLGGLWYASLLATSLRGAAWNLWSVAGVPYVSLPAASFVLLRADAVWGFHAVVWLLMVVWVADSSAYLVGRLIGGPRLAPRISPHKTWAGLGGAVAGGALAALGVAMWVDVAILWPLVLLGGVLAIIEQAGDLFESGLKRWAGVKDSGSIVPGHGGILDRVDGLIVAALAAALIGAANGEGRSAASGLLQW